MVSKECLVVKTLSLWTIVSGKPTKRAAQFWIKGELQKKSKAGGMFKGKIKTTGRRRGQKQLDVTDTGNIR